MRGAAEAGCQTAEAASGSPAPAFRTRPGATARSYQGFALGGVYLNPTRGRVQVAFEGGAPMEVRMALYDVLGRRVLVAHDAVTPAGAHTVDVGGEALAAGVYVLWVEAGGKVASRRLTVVR